MNGWVYEGFDVTWQRIRLRLSENVLWKQYLYSGKQFVMDGVKGRYIFLKEDGSVWIDLTEESLMKNWCCKDGTSGLYNTGPGRTKQKYDEFKYDQSLYVDSRWANYHMKVLKLSLEN